MRRLSSSISASYYYSSYYIALAAFFNLGDIAKLKGIMSLLLTPSFGVALDSVPSSYLSSYLDRQVRILPAHEKQNWNYHPLQIWRIRKDSQERLSAKAQSWLHLLSFYKRHGMGSLPRRVLVSNGGGGLWFLFKYISRISQLANR